MTSPEHSNSGEITHSLELRDRALVFMPGVTQSAKRVVTSGFYPVLDKKELKLTLVYQPFISQLDIDTEEVLDRDLSNDDAVHTYKHYRGIELSVADGKVLSYQESFGLTDEFGKVVDPTVQMETDQVPDSFTDAELDVLDGLEADTHYPFSQDKLSFLMDLLDIDKI